MEKQSKCGTCGCANSCSPWEVGFLFYDYQLGFYMVARGCSVSLVVPIVLCQLITFLVEVVCHWYLLLPWHNLVPFKIHTLGFSAPFFICISLVFGWSSFY